MSGYGQARGRPPVRGPFVADIGKHGWWEKVFWRLMFKLMKVKKVFVLKYALIGQYKAKWEFFYLFYCCLICKVWYIKEALSFS